jgi:phospholipase/carboxylesterase
MAAMSDKPNRTPDPHRGQPVLRAGEQPEKARAAILALHGRGARAEDILSLTSNLALEGVAVFAPQAAGDAWYPNRFMAPLESNEPWLSSALAFVERTLEQIGNQGGIPPERTLLLGFSQGACLMLEFAARHARRYGGLVGLSGGLIGPEGLRGRAYPGSLAGTPVFLGCSDVDFHIPAQRVDEAAAVLGALGGVVTERLYPGMGHTVNADELDFVGGMLKVLVIQP